MALPIKYRGAQRSARVTWEDERGPHELIFETTCLPEWLRTIGLQKLRAYRRKSGQPIINVRNVVVAEAPDIVPHNTRIYKAPPPKRSGKTYDYDVVADPAGGYEVYRNPGRQFVGHYFSEPEAYLTITFEKMKDEVR